MIQEYQSLLYAQDPAKSAEFYASLLGLKAEKLSPFFSVVRVREGYLLAFWARAKAPEGWTTQGESGELCLITPEDELKALHERWAGQGVKILQAPQKMYYGGWNFVAEDLDGHRIRVSTPDR